MVFRCIYIAKLDYFYGILNKFYSFFINSCIRLKHTFELNKPEKVQGMAFRGEISISNTKMMVKMLILEKDFA
jgi:hypothetical protein